ncbi:variable surface lipoprotein, partial [Mycoplasmopsis bovis]
MFWPGFLPSSGFFSSLVSPHLASIPFVAAKCGE